MNGTLNWRDLEIFHAVLEQGSFSGAARALGISQPTVSRHMESLERGLGKELFTRADGGLEPSETALTLGEHTAHMNDCRYAIQRVLDGAEDGVQGLVTINVPHGIGSLPLAHCLSRFHESYPDISIDLKFGPAMVDLSRREADIELRLGRPTQQDLVTARMGAAHFGFYATDAYLSHYGTPQQAADLVHHALPHVDEFVMIPFLQALEDFGATPQKFPLRCSGNTLLAAVLAAIGLTLIAMPIGLQLPTMRRVLPEFHWETQPLWINMHSGLRRNARIRAVWSWLTEHLPPVVQRTRE